MIDTLQASVASAFAAATECGMQVTALATAHPILTFQAFTAASIFALTRAGSAA